VKAFVLSIVVSLALVGGYLLAGGGTYEPTAVADPCSPRARPQSGDLLDPVQRGTLAVLDGAACDLDTSREQVLLDLVRRRNPLGASDARVKDAVDAGIDRAQTEGTIGGAEATALRLAVQFGGVGALLDLLRGS
jgi:hypothetical protein